MENLHAWCIVPYDAKERGPEERAAMLGELGLKRFAYDYRDVHIPTFDREVEAMKSGNIEIIAWWFPVQLDATARKILDTIKHHEIKPALWVSGWGGPVASGKEQRERVAEEVARLRPICVAAKELGCEVGLYNHQGWFGDPDNELAVLQGLRSEGLDNVSIVYNFHHAHEHVRMFPTIWPRISGYVSAINVSGVAEDGDLNGKKILYVGEGDHEERMLRTILDSGWRGSVGVLSHRTEVDAAVALRRNMSGLAELVRALRQDVQPAAESR